MMASAQAAATRKYEKKVGIVAKSFKIKKELVDEFKIACEREGVSQSGQITKMIQEFVNESNKKNGKS